MSATPPAPSPRDGPLISGRYRILRRLGAGSVGTVYLARDLSARRPLALKVIQRELLSADGARSLQEEFRAIASLHHPQIAAAYDFGYSEEGGLPFYTREHVDGAPLPPGPPDADGQADPGRFLRPLFDLLDALHYLHTHEILHLDIHAGNLIVANDPERGAVLIDFGLFRARRVSLASSVFLSRSSLAPEVLHGGSASFPADIYSVGRLLLYRLTGSYDGEARLPREIPGWGPRLTLELERIVGKAIQREPEQRFSSALEFREALAAALGSGDGAPRPGEPGELTVGREPELARLEEGLRRAAAGRTAALWFKGPAGVGKSRLLTEARWRGQIRGLEVADVRFLPEADAAPAARQIVRSLRAGRRGGHWLAALSREHGGSSEERARRAASAFFSRAGPPLVLLLDDFENADRESRLLGEALLAECLGRLREGSPGRGLLVVVASSRSPRRGVVRSGARSIVRPLRPLSEKSSRELLRAWLRPLEAPDRLLSRLARPSRGNALRLRRLAVALRSEYGATGKLPADVRLPLSSRISLAAGRRDWGERERKVLEVLAAFGRGADREEIAAAADMTPKSMATALRRLRQAEVVASLPEGRRRLYYLADPRARAALLGGLARHDVSRMYRRAADWLRKNPDPSPREREALARHLLAAGRQREGAAAALEAAAVLSEKGLHEPAVRLLEDASRRETNRRRRLELAEEISKRHHEAGDHLEAIAQLEPVFRAEETYLRGREAVRIRRRLGVHYHRAGRAEAAVRFFEEARRRAKESRDREELVFIFSELAELHTFRGEYAEAERACRAGLELLERGPRALENVVGAMEITLRASLGHLELRRFELERARREFEAALALARSYGTAADRAVILNNLGIAYNQLDRLGKARSSFRQAEKLLAAAGERRALVQTACNLAVIAAKGGDADRADDDIRRAHRLLREHPGERLKFFVAICLALTHYLLGRMHRAFDAFEAALPLGRRLGDEYMVRFGEVYLTEALLVSGRHDEASRTLRSTWRHVEKSGSPVLRRVVLSRLVFLEWILGRERERRAAVEALRQTPRTSVALLEAWNDVFLAVAGCEETGESRRLLEAARDTFRSIGIPAGRRLARLGLLSCALRAKDGRRVRALLSELERSDDDRSHSALSVLEPLLRAEASFFLGELDRCARSLQEASGAVVGLPFIELDWRIEFLRAAVGERQGDRDGARHHLHRALQARNLMLCSVPARWRRSFLAHPRFATLGELEARLERVKTLTPVRIGEGAFRGIVGEAPSMQRLFSTVNRVSDLELPVLVVGETGSGKEVVARAVHQSGPRRHRPFGCLHCSSLPSELFESELFGYEAGAFTGAEEARPGLLEHFDGGVLFLDEITHLSTDSQRKLLRVLDTRTFRPLASTEARPLDLRFIASTSVEPREAVRRGELRQDLYYRLAGVELRVPPLRARREDVPLLVRHFLEHHGRRLERPAPVLSPDALAALSENDWPGNVRELETLVIRLLVELSPGTPVDRETVERHVASHRPRSVFPDEVFAGRDLDELRRELEKGYLLKLFEESGGDVPSMLGTLGIKRSYLYAWFRKLGIDIRELRRRGR